MITARTTPLKEALASAAAAPVPGDWPGPAVDDCFCLAQIAVVD